MYLKKPILSLAFLICLTSAAFAAPKPDLEMEARSQVRKNQHKNFFSLSVENDSLGEGTDQNYTSGVRATYFDVNADIPAFVERISGYIPTFNINETTSLAYSIGQNLYTPRNIRSKTLNRDDRPWAAWLYASTGLTTLTTNHIDELELTLGVVGPAALGEQAQKTVHSIISSPDPQGWDHQLKNEPGVIVSWLRRWPEAINAEGLGLYAALEPNINMSLGNVYTYAGTGVTLRISPREDRWQDVPPRVRPAIPGTGYFEAPKNDWSWYLFAGAEGRAVARNIFLDGNTFADSHSVEKETFVGDLNAGVAFTYKQTRISYSLNYRSSEFKKQNGDALFGSLTFSFAF